MSDATASETVRLSGNEEQPIAEGVFPVPCYSDSVRVWMSPEAHGRIAEHATSNTRIELCGVLVGQVLRDSLGLFLVIEDIVRGKDADNHPARVTFTQQTWAQIFSELDREHQGRRILGWYHTHPGFGVFLSPMDRFIQENFFNLPWQVAFVVDPLSGDEGLFRCGNGTDELALSYWVGNYFRLARLRLTVQRDEMQVLGRGDTLPAESLEAKCAPPAQARSSSKWDVLETVLLVLILLSVLFQSQVQRIVEKLLAYLK